jgi:hypothetical protein
MAAHRISLTMRGPSAGKDAERTIRFGRRPARLALHAPHDRPREAQRAERGRPRPDQPPRATGHVDEIAEPLRADVTGELLVALGAGRVSDVTKALAATAGAPVAPPRSHRAQRG